MVYDIVLSDIWHIVWLAYGPVYLYEEENNNLDIIEYEYERQAIQTSQYL